MTFETIKNSTQRQAFTLVEFWLDINDPSLDSTYALQQDSFGTPKTTDDPTAFTGTDFRVYRYCDQQLFGVDHFAGLKSVRTNTPKINPGKTIGFRATGTITLTDFIDSDEFSLQGLYADRRVTGSHFLKMLARNHYINRRVKIIRGYDPFNYDEASAQVENYIVDSISQPDESGNVKVSVIDELILTEGKKSKAPLVSVGVLSSPVNSSVTTLNFTTTVLNEYGVVSDTGVIVIQDEIMTYTVASSTSLTVVRGQRGTQASSHQANDSIQICIDFQDVNIIDIITQLITDHTKIPNSYIPTVAWDALKTGDLIAYNLTRTIFEPKEVKKLLNELILLAGLSMYIDVINQDLVIVASPDFSNPSIVFDENEHVISKSIKILHDFNRQITRQAIVWDKANTTGNDDAKNFRKSFQVIDGIVEGDADISLVSEGKTVKSNWLINSVEDNQLATNLVQREVNRFSRVPIVASMTIDQRYINNVASGRVWLGSVFSILSSRIVDAGLNPIQTTCQCIEIKPSREDGQWDIKGLSYVTASPIIADLFITQDQVDYVLTDDLTTTEEREYVVVINAGVTISCSIPSQIAFSQGSFFVGATLKLVNLGRIVGCGGNGGNGGDGGPGDITCQEFPGTTGGAGGDALLLTTNAEIDNGFGNIFSGGGGGAGADGGCFEDQGGFFSEAGSGGGGGRGGSGGAGGLAGTGIGDAIDGLGGTSGSLSAFGLGGDSDEFFTKGGDGGEFGEQGGNATGQTGGLAGIAINKNGNTVTISAGNNSAQIKGLIVN